VYKIAGSAAKLANWILLHAYSRTAALIQNKLYVAYLTSWHVVTAYTVNWQ